MTDTITLPRSVVERALHAIKYSSACVSKQLTTQTKHDYALGLLAEANDALRAALEQPQVEQETVGEAGSMPGTDGFTMVCFRASDVPVGTKLYTHPQPQREPLTEMEIVELRQLTPGTLDVQFVKFARAIERAHGIGGEA